MYNILRVAELNGATYVDVKVREILPAPGHVVCGTTVEEPAVDLVVTGVGVLYPATYRGISRGSRLVGRESSDLELEGKSEDTRHKFIQVQAARVA